jgi:hypothetical protein
MAAADPPRGEVGSSSASQPAANADVPRVRRGGTTVRLISELTGSLPCVRCRYDLKGLSIRGVCPECGTPVRATLLAVVDPRAGELQPIDHPRATAAGLVAWSSAALLSVIGGWCVWAGKSLPGSRLEGYLPAMEYGIVGLLAVSGIGAAALVHPHRNIPERSRRQALLGTLAYAPLIGLVGWLLIGRWPTETSSSVVAWAATSVSATIVKLMVAIVTVGIILLLRSNARLLAARSVLLREGRVDRQHLLALASVLGVAVFGESLTLIGLSIQAGEAVVLIGQVLVVVAGVLFTLGLIGVVVDCWRIRRAVLQPPLSLESLLESPGPNQ